MRPSCCCPEFLAQDVEAGFEDVVFESFRFGEQDFHGRHAGRTGGKSGDRRVCCVYGCSIHRRVSLCVISSFSRL
jgi:hypothetical protein